MRVGFFFFFFCAEQTQTFNALFINVLLQQIVR